MYIYLKLFVYNYFFDTGNLSLITHVDVQAAHESDADALLPYLEAAEQHDIKLKQKDLFCTLTDFEFSENGFAISCPDNCRPVKKSKKKDRFSIAFSSERCGACPRFHHRPVKPGKKNLAYLRYNEKNVRLSRRRRYEQTDEFKEKYRFRAGVEATMSQLDRRTGIAPPGHESGSFRSDYEGGSTQHHTGSRVQKTT